jgi:predicted ester cyclase
MDVERNKQTVRRVFEEGFSAGRLEVVDECLTADAVDRHDFTAEAPDFRSHLKGIITMLRSAMPDLTMTVEDLIAEGDRVAARVIMTGTHNGEPFFGVDAQGNAVRVEQFHIVQCDDDGRGVVHWAAAGEEDLLRQMGTAVTVAAS